MCMMTGCLSSLYIGRENLSSLRYGRSRTIQPRTSWSSEFWISCPAKYPPEDL